MIRLRGTRGAELVYDAAEEFVERGLRSDDSLFTPGRPVWSTRPIEDFYRRFVLDPDESSDSFIPKLRRQLESAPDLTIQFVAELLYVHFLISVSVGGAAKRRVIQEVLSLMSERAEMPQRLVEVLDGGIASTGIGFNTNRPGQLSFFVEFLRHWKGISGEDRAAALHDPWELERIVDSVPAHSGYMQREALLHLVYPDTFESIVSQGQKNQIAQRFHNLVKNSGASDNRQIFEIREALVPQYGEDFNFYDDDIRPLWAADGQSPWDKFIHWGKRFYEWDGFDAAERIYKVEVSERIAAARQAVLTGNDNWVDLLKKSFGGGNNLTDWRLNSRFIQWVESHPDQAKEALRALWAEGEPFDQRFTRFKKIGTSEATRGGPLALMSFLNMAVDPYTFPNYRWSPFFTGAQLTNVPQFDSETDPVRLYQDALDFLDQIVQQASERGLPLRDRLDAQSVLWAVAKYKPNEPPLSEWTENERREFLRYRDNIPPDDEDGEPVGEFADRLLVPPGWVAEVLDPA